MKGDKQLKTAKLISLKINEFPSLISSDEKIKLYSTYSELIKKVLIWEIVYM
jgi:predicted HTH domain antitoxin